MKLNWGHYIVISFVLFVGLIIYMVYRSFQHDNDLVAEDYYAKEIQFQEIIDKKENVSRLGKNITWKSQDEGVMVNYPEIDGVIEGEILLFRPSDKDLDVVFKVAPNPDKQQFLIDDSFTHGKYLIQISWNVGEEEYYTEGTAYVIKI